MPHFTEPEVYLTPPLARDIVKIKKLRQLYFEDLQVKPNGEPVCHKIFVSEGEDTVLKIADIITEDSQPEKNLLNLSEKELLNLGELLAAGLESVSWLCMNGCFMQLYCFRITSRTSTLLYITLHSTGDTSETTERPRLVSRNILSWGSQQQDSIRLDASTAESEISTMLSLLSERRMRH